MVDKQKQFEESIILESELNGKDEDMYRTLDNISTECLTLSEFQSEYGKDLDLEVREHLVVYINYKFSKLNDLQLKIANLRYKHNLTYRQISKRIDRPISTINYQLKKIDTILRSN
jgi:DNA-directed RNA polymerase specialized sigma24 family protein